jgi:hypothetical protein
MEMLIERSLAMTPFRMILLGAAALSLTACGNKPAPEPASQALLAHGTEYVCSDRQVRIGMAGERRCASTARAMF